MAAFSCERKIIPGGNQTRRSATQRSLTMEVSPHFRYPDGGRRRINQRLPATLGLRNLLPPSRTTSLKSDRQTGDPCSQRGSRPIGKESHRQSSRSGSFRERRAARIIGSQCILLAFSNGLRSCPGQRERPLDSPWLALPRHHRSNESSDRGRGAGHCPRTPRRLWPTR